ncbi:ankyrin repeat domain-containing protein SOWAHC-like [Brachionichthys hirsutus]|uniref:ankyrin repeat domain-containing protein SOWAHC-like n=1 Tax=Brachionichthys hirsutus TaxID=412623 RepID=UPI0036048F58
MDSRTASHSGNRTFIYLWTDSQFQQEQAEWDDLNKLLQHHGFKPVNFSDPGENRNLSDLVLLDKKSAADLRATMRMMLGDSERRQTLIQELIRSNSRLKEDAQDHMSRAARHSRRVSEVEALLDAVKNRVQDLEDRCLGEAARRRRGAQQLQREKLEAQKRCKGLEQKLSKREDEAAQLEKKLHFAVKEEERRLARRSEAFRRVCDKEARKEEARKTPGDSEEEARKTPGDSEEEARKTPGEVRKTPDIPQITVVAASPLPTDASAFVLPGPAGAGGAGLRPGGGRGDGLEKPERVRGTVDVVDVGDDGDDGDDGEGDARSLSGSEGSVSPKPSRRRIARSVMGGSPPPRRRAASGGLSPSDSLSLASSNGDEDRLALDPLEHEWMMSSSDGEWAGLRRLLAAEPGLLPRRDFVTGFSCLHWAAKLGKPELLARLVDFAERSGVPAGVDVRSGGGYTPLHVAAMHGHVEVVKLLVGAYGADVDVRDYGGRKASHYLADDASVDIRDIVGACGDAGAEDADTGDSRRRKRPNVLRSKPRPPGLRLPPEGEVRTRRKTSFSRMKPKLERLRLRTSQIVHSASFWDKEDQEPPPDSFRSRPKTHFLG